jgi:NADH:ubiquinone oxidoreductase subunit D
MRREERMNKTVWIDDLEYADSANQLDTWAAEIMDGFHEFTPVERSLVLVVARQSEQIRNLQDEIARIWEHAATIGGAA